MPSKLSKDLALELIPDAAQRQLLEALADMQTLPDDHPTWALIAMFAVMLNGSRSGLDATATELARLASEVAELKNQAAATAVALAQANDQLHQAGLVLADAAHMNRRMPAFLDKLEETFADTRTAIRSINAKIGRQ